MCGRLIVFTQGQSPFRCHKNGIIASFANQEPCSIVTLNQMYVCMYKKYQCLADRILGHASLLSQMQSLLPNLPKPCVPEEGDKLSEQEIEELATELMKAFDSPAITNDPYMSPMLATPEMLAGLPPVHLVVRLAECTLLK